MLDDRWLKRMLGWKPVERRNPGCLRRNWRENVNIALESKGLLQRDWNDK
jgi:hypothetical protein